MKHSQFTGRFALALTVAGLLTAAVLIGSSPGAQLPVASASALARPLAAPGDTYCVATTGGSYPGCTLVFINIQTAVDAANGLETIKVAQGTYAGVNARPAPAGYFGPGGNITQALYITKTVFIQGGYTTTNWTTPDPVAHPTTLDAQGQGRVVLIAGDITPTLAGLRLTNGNATNLGGFDNSDNPPPDALDVGGGVYILNATATLSNSWVTNNAANTDPLLPYSAGGGIYLDSSPSTLYANTVATNTAQDGGGIALYLSTGSVSYNSIYGNSLYDGGYGGGIYLDGSNFALIDHNTIMTNSASDGNGGGVGMSNAALITLADNIIVSNTASSLSGSGAGVFLLLTSATLQNNIIADNQAGGYGPGVYIGAGSTIDLFHNTLARNAGGEGSGVHVEGSGASTVFLYNTILVSHTIGLVADAGNTVQLDSTLFGGGTDIAGTMTDTVNLNPYTGNPGFVNPTAGNYHITGSSAANDKGIDAGITTDIDDDVRPIGLGFDLGADELYNPALTATKSASSSSALPGAVITYTIRLTNTGNVTLTSYISDTLPSRVTFKGPITVNPAGGTIGAPPAIVGGQSIGIGGAVTVTFPVTLNTGAGMTAGTIIANSAAITTSPTTLIAQPIVGTANVTVLNAPPIAANDVYATSVNTSINMNVLNNDTDLNGDALTVSAVGTPLNGTATINSGASVIYTPTTGFAGTNVFTYTARDPGGLSSTASITITVANIPISGLTAQNSSPTAYGTSTLFTATVAAGSSVAYTWNFGDGSTTTGQFASHTYSAAGNYTAIVTATNNVPSTASVTTAVTITKATPAIAITADTPDPSIVGQSVAITFALTPPGAVLPTGMVTITDGAQLCVATLPTTACSITFASAGLKTLTAHYGGDDNFNAVISPDAAHTVNDVPISGLAATNNSPTLVGGSTAFTATITAGTNVAYQWNFGDGGTGSGANTAHTYAIPGSYTALVTATNFSGSQLATTTVTVVAQAGLSLVATDAPDPASIGKPLVYTLVIHNGGPTNADSVVVTDTLPAGVTFGSAVTNQGTCSAPTVTCNIGTLINGGTVTVTIVVTPSMLITSPMIIANSAGVSSATADPTPADNASTITTTINPRRLFLPLIRR
jgi:uncharacterized repeat protein (TIGR01451 family)